MNVLQFLDNPKKHFKAKGQCPWCSRTSVFEPLGIPDKAFSNGTYANGGTRHGYIGLRHCPGCSHVLAVFCEGVDEDRASVREIWHRPTPSFQKEGLSEVIAEALDESWTCYNQGLYRPAAMSIRRAIELICDEHGATDGMLGKRISTLEKQMALPNGMLQGFRVLSFLGNDAAHVEMRNFNDVGKQEVSIALELVTEIANALYRHKELLRKLEKLKKDQEK